MLELSEMQRVGVGEFTDVFAAHDGSSVCKIYRVAGSPKWREWGERVGKQEMMAYEIAAATPALQPHIARYLGPVEVRRVVDVSGTDISERYFLSTAFLLERVSGEEAKALGLPPRRYPHVYSLLEKFDAAGIEVGDASVFDYKSLKTTKFIDIITKYGAQILAEVI